MKKNFLFIGILLTSLVVLGGILSKEKTLEQIKNNENIELAIYINDEEISTIPLKNSGFIFDSEKSSCTNNASISWDNESWSPVVKNMSEYKTKCTIAFRDYYLLTVLDNNDTQVYQIPLSDSSTSIRANTNHTLLACNQGVELTNSNEDIVVNNIQSDVFCRYYDSSVDAINELDDSKNYFIYLKDENLSNDLTIIKGKKLTMDLNGYKLNEKILAIWMYGVLDIISSSTTMGEVNASINIYSQFYLNNVSVISNNSALIPCEESSVQVKNSRLISTGTAVESTVWMHSARLELFDSYIEGPYAIGGEGGEILIDSSELVGTIRNALQVNRGFYGNVTVLGSSIFTGELGGIMMYKGTLTLESDSSSSPIIRGNNSSGLSLGTEDVSIFNFNAGDIYGKFAPNVNGTINVADGKTMVSVDENGIIHTYLQ